MSTPTEPLSPETEITIRQALWREDAEDAYEDAFDELDGPSPGNGVTSLALLDRGRWTTK